uniref:Uncharacterized protein n=1 Tax=Anguilla anguilla TaxID=7936 RepID=A0A0E9T6R5_ANGAN
MSKGFSVLKAGASSSHIENSSVLLAYFNTDSHSL